MYFTQEYVYLFISYSFNLHIHFFSLFGYYSHNLQIFSLEIIKGIICSFIFFRKFELKLYVF